jgi:2-polyprenyl-6-methoxyphenol hydroxylase-like FAD-dependent oxidoreductase
MKVLIIGGGICGLGTALLLARDGHDITLLERDPDPLPPSAHGAWDAWGRKGVAQFRQPHNFMPGLRRLLENELPEIQSALARAGATHWDLVNPLPPMLRDRTPRAIDAQLWTLTARRPIGEWVFASACENDPRITMRRGTQVKELLTGAPAINSTPHVTGVCTTDGEELRGDLVVDATGRASRAPKWLAAIGTRPAYEEQADCGFIYYTRYFRGTMPERRGPSLMPAGSVSILTLLGDNGTWSVTIFTGTGDQPLKKLRNEETWTNVVRAFPLHAHWLDGEPITDVLPMSGIVDRYRRLVVDHAPIVTGLVTVADAWACTNPSAGRGLTVGFLHAQQLRDALREASGNPAALVETFDRKTESEVTPWYRAQISVDRARFAEMEAVREGRMPEPGDALAQQTLGLMMSMMVDPDLFRAALEYIGTLTPVQTILARPEVGQRMAAVREAMKHAPPMRMPAPNRQQLLELMN